MQSINKYIILGAGKPLEGREHSALHKIQSNTSVLDWILKTIPSEINEVEFVGGYDVDFIKNNYPNLSIIVNEKWKDTGAVGSLLVSDLPTQGKVLVSYSDILYRSDLVNHIYNSDFDVVVAIDSKWIKRYHGRSPQAIASCEKVFFKNDFITRLGADISINQANAEFLGLICLNSAALKEIGEIPDNILEEISRYNLSKFVEWFRINGLSIGFVDVLGDWAEMDDPKDLSHFILGTKAETLHRLQPLVTASVILDQVSFSVKNWSANKEYIIRSVVDKFQNSLLVIRSSALSEDGFNSANAGAYESILEVPANIPVAIDEAVEKVIASYADNDTRNQVLIQPMIDKIRSSGVVFTRSLTSGAPYYIINYDDFSGSTSSITSGNSKSHKTLIVSRRHIQANIKNHQNIDGLLYAIREVENILGYDSLDIEFAVDINGNVVIFQVRPIAVDHSQSNLDEDDFYQILADAENHFNALQKPSPFILGSKTVFGIMPDWNPAEIIGTKPNRLSSSLYSYLIMDDIWATQRAEYGYRDVRPMPLLTSFAGHPYVDCRASINSFIPAGLPKDVAGKIVEFAIKKLVKNPQFHDKLEFEILPTCFSFDNDRWINIFKDNRVLDKSETDHLFEGLKQITLNAFKRNKIDFQSIDKLHERYDQIFKSDVSDIQKIWLYLEDCKRYGTLAFAHLARSGFVAVTLLKSAVSKSIISQAAMDDFLQSVNTVSNEIQNDAQKVALHKLSWDSFVNKYGHLRPGTYDITSENYAGDVDRYLKPLIKTYERQNHEHESGCWNNEKIAFHEALLDIGLTCEIEEMEEFLKSAIAGREYAKFIFTKNLSGALEHISSLGEKIGLSKQDLSALSINDVLSLRHGYPITLDINSWVREKCSQNNLLKEYVTSIELPPLLIESSDFYLFDYPITQPNFITSKSITEGIIDLAKYKGSQNLPNINGKIVIIPQADPGYDWLFGHNIGGLITMYGGANSHMAIRSAEFGLPAAIGIGEKEFERLSKAQIVELNAGNRQINIIR